MTFKNEDGHEVDYTPDYMRYRCEQMGVKCVPVFARDIIPHYTMLPDVVGSPQETNAGQYALNLAEKFYDGPDPVGKTHVREGVVVRITNRPKFTAYKHKNFSFKVLSNIAVADAEASGATEGMSEDMLAEM